ncbi:MAG: hypothetical protein KF824_07630 [Fimbriimonadaceae bacterium]|nr:MAG: hypothetical protein KF824_07630 [Fimbriimonadaceae bacterium]
MNRRLVAGTSLIEVLTVIVVFLVGILAVVQIFPPGLAVLRENRAHTQAIAMARAEVQRVLGQSAQIPERIVPGRFDTSGNIFIISGANPNELNPPVDSGTGIGELSSAGQVLDGGTPIGHWTKLTASNLITRVIGEGKPIAQPTTVNGIPGSLGSRMQLLFGPIYYQYDGPNNRSLGQVLSVYGNDLRRTQGSADDQNPNSAEPIYDTDSFAFVPGTEATLSGLTPAGFVNKDQIWIGRLQDLGTSTLKSHAYRVSMSFIYNDGVADRVVEAIFTAFPNTSNAYYRELNNYAVISLPDMLTGSAFAPAGYRGVELASVRVQRVFQEVPNGTAFDPYDPYQFKPWNYALGMLMLNPAGANETVKDENGNDAPLMARVDYSVYDWRIIRDEFQVPGQIISTGYNPVVKLLANQIMPASGTQVDGRPFGGIALAGDNFMYTPNLTGALGSQDFVLVDLQSGGVIAGNTGVANSCYEVDKSSGNIRFQDTDPSDALVVTGHIWYPDGTFGGWVDSGPVEIAGRRVQALYMATGEYAVQMLKASSSYNVVYPTAANQLAAGQCYEGGSNGWGQTNRLYFPLIDSGQKVTAGELWVAGYSEPVIRDRDLKISGIESIGGTTVAYAELPPGVTFDASRNNYAVRRVEGASVKVRSFYNPQRFNLSASTTENFARLARWSQFFKVTQTETFDAGGNN